MDRVEEEEDMSEEDSCMYCVFWDDGDGNEFCESCKLDEGDTNPRNSDKYRYMGCVDLSEWPCKYHRTPDEIKQLIDGGMKR